MRPYVRFLLFCLPLLTAQAPHASARRIQPQSERTASAADTDLRWTTDATQPQRFVAVHGRRSVAMGYPETGLEVWAYPLQLVSGYQVSFVAGGDTQVISGTRLLRRIDYYPERVVRTYIGPDFIVRETIFVPLNEPGAIFTYEVEGSRDISIRVRFVPELNLMWPGAIGGQSTSWNDHDSGYSIREPLYGFSAEIASPEAVSHDEIVNSAIVSSPEKTLVLNPRPTSKTTKSATVFIVYDNSHPAENLGTLHRLETGQASLMSEAAEHYKDLLTHALQIRTPDAEINRALAWSTISLDQAWVCNQSLGCGEVAGYGPSRPGRRPQYAWYFAGDGLVAVNAWIADGEYERARDELAFIAKYQDKKNGMIWHEMSQSAALIDWQKKYPYMYVHVDITFEYLAALAHYIAVSGDTGFLKANWSDIQAAYRYCQSIIDPESGLPQIPADREGSNEQDRMRDDLSLSSSWISASLAYEQMARIMGAQDDAEHAAHAAESARQAIASRDWDAAHHFWLAGHTLSGKPIYDQRPHPTELLAQGVFSPDKVSEVLDQIASPDFQADWGIRSMSASSREFDPDSYSKGSVSALSSSSIASAFWQQHRPVTAWQIWQALTSWSTLDSEGHIHELLAGNFYHPQIESVPEQTWSSAGFLSSAVEGLLGLSVESAKHHLTFRPELPAQWNTITVANIRVADSVVRLQITRDQNGLEFDIENRGSPVSLDFRPQIPFGANVRSATLSDSSAHEGSVQVNTQRNDQDEHAVLAFTAAPGKTHCRIVYEGGVQILISRSHLLVGDRSRQLKITGIHFAGNILTIDAFVPLNEKPTLDLVTGWTPVAVHGGSVQKRSSGEYVVQFDAAPANMGDSQSPYAHVKAVIELRETQGSSASGSLGN